jgi:ribonuclease HI
MIAGRHGAILRQLAAAARTGALAPLPAAISPDEAAAALAAGADALGAPPAGVDAAPSPRAGGRVRIHVDGASRGNPGPAGFGAVLEALPGGPRETHCAYLGEATNNVAEYRALLWALAEARRRGFAEAEVWSDSELMVKQMRGEYRVKEPRLRALHAEATDLARAFRTVSIRHAPREHNAEADALANRAIDEATARGHRRSS